MSREEIFFTGYTIYNSGALLYQNSQINAYG